MFSEELWIPDHNPPQIDRSDLVSLTNDIRQFGAIEVANGAITRLETSQQRIGAYLDEFGFRLNAINEDYWPAWALRLGAAIAHWAYDFSNQSIIVDKTFDLSCALAEIQGIPEAYAANMYNDQGLQEIIQIAFEDERLQKVDGQGLLQVSIIGAGCVRFFMQEALLAA